MSFYDEIELEDLTYHPSLQLYTYPCPCGDQFEICVSDMRDGEEVAVCPSCSLQIRVIFEMVSFFFFFCFGSPRPSLFHGRWERRHRKEKEKKRKEEGEREGNILCVHVNSHLS
jgi:diphthamide biosynthesis protein 3